MGRMKKAVASKTTRTPKPQIKKIASKEKSKNRKWTLSSELSSIILLLAVGLSMFLFAKLALDSHLLNPRVDVDGKVNSKISQLLTSKHLDFMKPAYNLSTNFVAEIGQKSLAAFHKTESHDVSVDSRSFKSEEGCHLKFPATCDIDPRYSRYHT